jgi:hypothetical protein
MQFFSYGLAPLRSPLHIAQWLGCTVLLAQLGGGQQAFGVNTAPVVIAVSDQQVLEGDLLDLSGDNGTPALGFFADPDQGDTHQATANWGDGTPTQTPTIFFTAGYGVLGGAHYYADNGLYTVTVTVTDGVGASDSDTSQVRVVNVNPTLGVTPSPTSIAAGQSVSFNAAFSDPGFDNPLNTLDPSNGGELVESFRYYLSWGDGLNTIATQDVADINGGPGVASSGVFNGSHTYANDGAFTVIVRLADDDMGAYADAALFVTGVLGTDFVEQTFTVTVSPIPEPAAIVLTMLGLACFSARRRHRTL